MDPPPFLRKVRANPQTGDLSKRRNRPARVPHFSRISRSAGEPPTQHRSAAAPPPLHHPPPPHCYAGTAGPGPGPGPHLIVRGTTYYGVETASWERPGRRPAGPRAGRTASQKRRHRVVQGRLHANQRVPPPPRHRIGSRRIWGDNHRLAAAARLQRRQPRPFDAAARGGLPTRRVAGASES